MALLMQIAIYIFNDESDGNWWLEKRRRLSVFSTTIGEYGGIYARKKLLEWKIRFNKFRRLAEKSSLKGNWTAAGCGHDVPTEQSRPVRFHPNFPDSIGMHKVTMGVSEIR
jgi:hypothetical protein